MVKVKTWSTESTGTLGRIVSMTIVQQKVDSMAEGWVLLQVGCHHSPQHQVCRLPAGHRILLSSESRIHRWSFSVSSLSRWVVGVARWSDWTGPVA